MKVEVDLRRTDDLHSLVIPANDTYPLCSALIGQEVKKLSYAQICQKTSSCSSPVESGSSADRAPPAGDVIMTT